MIKNEEIEDYLTSVLVRGLSRNSDITIAAVRESPPISKKSSVGDGWSSKPRCRVMTSIINTSTDEFTFKTKNYTLFYRQLGCLAFSLVFWPKIKQFLSNCPASDWTFSFKTACFCYIVLKSKQKISNC